MHDMTRKCAHTRTTHTRSNAHWNYNRTQHTHAQNQQLKKPHSNAQMNDAVKHNAGRSTTDGADQFNAATTPAQAAEASGDENGASTYAPTTTRPTIDEDGCSTTDGAGQFNAATTPAQAPSASGDGNGASICPTTRWSVAMMIALPAVVALCVAAVLNTPWSASHRVQCAPPTEAVSASTRDGGVFAMTMEEKMMQDNYITCPTGGTCVETPFGAQFAGRINYTPRPAPGMDGSIPPEIGGMVKLTRLYECGSIHARGRCCPSMYALLTLIHPFFRL